jgi:osmotically-inducible protein OsmY
MTHIRTVFRISLIAALLACGFIQGCAASDTYRKCGAGCPGDKELTDQIRTLLFHRADILAADIEVQTLDGVVYLHGLIDTDVQRHAVLDAVGSVKGVVRVVDSLSLRNDMR